MSLDLSETVVQIDALAQRLTGLSTDHANRLQTALRAVVEADPLQVKAKADGGQGRPYLFASPVDEFAGRHEPHVAPRDFCVASVDGSHIDVDRDTPARCYLINVGGCVLTYGSRPDAHLFSHPSLYAEDGDLYITSSTPESVGSVSVEGPLLGLKRAVEEVKGLVDSVRDVPRDLPVLALVDGTLLLWGLAGRAYPPFVKEELLGKGLIQSLDRLREMAQEQTMAVAAYTSLPQSREVVNALRLYRCPVEAGECSRLCTSHRSGRAPCDALDGLLDRQLFQEHLGPGERSSLYRSNSSISRESYGHHQVHFYYVNTGDEIARVEVPMWVAESEGLLELSHTLILDQCRRGGGYPAAIAEAHEKAVVTGPDREAFKQMLADALYRNHLPVHTSEKARSKRMRSL